MVARANPYGRVTLLNKELTQRDLAGVSTTKTIESAAELAAVLQRDFGIQVGDAELLFATVP